MIAGPEIDVMARALALAERGRGTTSPNPMVGAVIVDDDGVVVGRGSHGFAGGPHAEVIALADAGTRARGATLYCTLEPCSHTGRTGPCAPLVIAAGIRRAVIAMEDPNPLVSGRGIGQLRQHGVETVVGVLREAAEALNGPFLTTMRIGRPQVTMKVAVSADGRVGFENGRRAYLTGEKAGRRVHRDRAEIDGIAIGSGTLIADDPVLTARGAFRRRPLTRIVFDRRLRTPSTARLLSTLAAGPVIIMSTVEQASAAPNRAAALEQAGAVVRLIPDDAGGFLAAALRTLSLEGITSLTVEGGPAVHRALWDAGLVDRVQIYVASHTIGPAAVAWFTSVDAVVPRLDRMRTVPLGSDVLIEGDVHRSD